MHLRISLETMVYVCVVERVNKNSNSFLLINT